MPKIKITKPSWKFLSIYFSIVAIGISIYSVYVHRQIERAAEEDEEYEPSCDFQVFDQPVKCSDALSSSYAKGFGLEFLPEIFRIPNGVYGTIFYLIIAGLSEFFNQFVKTIISTSFSL